MFSDIWNDALVNYNNQKHQKKLINNFRNNIKKNQKQIRINFNNKYKNYILNNENNLLKYVINNNCNKLLLQEININRKIYRNFIIENNNFFSYQKVTNDVYYVFLKWNYYDTLLNKISNKIYYIKFKFYCKHDFPYEMSFNLKYTLSLNGYYLNSKIREYLYYHLMKLWKLKFNKNLK